MPHGPPQLEEPKMARQDVEFASDGLTLKGHFYTPDSGSGPFPTIVMGGGWCYVKELIQPEYAQFFVDQGMADQFLERELRDIHPDILLAGVNGSRLGLYKYDDRLLRVTGYPSVVIPTHWDNFQLPYDFSQEANRTRNLVPFRKTVKELAPETRVIDPTHLKTIVVR